MIFNNLKTLMEERKITIKDIHEETSLSRRTISKLVNNYSAALQFDTLDELCKLLNVDISDILIRADSKEEFERIVLL